jgi:cell division protein FtsB
MSILVEIRKRGRYAILPVVCALGTTYFGYHMIHGEYGFLAYMRLNKEIQTLTAEREQAIAQRKAAEHRVALLRPGTLDRDMLDERARETLGYADAPDLVIVEKR